MLLQLGFCPLPHTPAYDELVKLAELHAAASTDANVAEVRVVVAGAAKVLHAVAVAYLALQTTRPELASLVRFRFFVVPFAALPLAGYIARHDSWYNRHIQVCAHAHRHQMMQSIIAATSAIRVFSSIQVT